MGTIDIIRAWKDDEYRNSLSVEQQELLPAHPAGALELTDVQLAQVVGGADQALCTNCSYAQTCGSSSIVKKPEFF